MDGTHAAARAGARLTLDNHSLLEDLLAGPAARPAWASAASLRPVQAACRTSPSWPAARRVGRPLSAAVTLLLAGGIVAASVGAAPARAEVATAPQAAAALAAPVAVPQTAVRGALAGLQLAPARDTALLARLMAAPAPRQADAALLAAMLATEPAAVAVAMAAPPAAVNFATVAKLPGAALSYSAAAQQLPMITLADNIPPPPPPPPAPVVVAQQPPPPRGYVPPPGYRDGVYLGGQFPGLAPGQFPATVGRHAPARPGVGRAATAPAVYIVRAGDTLSAIALHFYGDVRFAPRIWDANYRAIGANPNAIFPGQRLTLPGLTVQVVRPSALLPARSPIPAPSRYTIQPQDFLRWMAQRAYGNELLWPTIYHANRNVLGPNPDLIYPGVTVFVP